MSTDKSYDIVRWMTYKKYLTKGQAEDVLETLSGSRTEKQKINVLQVIQRKKLLDKNGLLKVQNEIRGGALEDLPGLERRALKVKKKAADKKEEVLKRCPECFASVPTDQKECPVCDAKMPLVAMARCKRCSQVNPLQAKSCYYCGSHPESGSPGPKTPKCGHCKKSVLPEDALCLSCGWEIKSLSESKQSWLERVLIAAIVLFSYLALSTAYVQMGQVNSQRVKLVKAMPFESVKPEWIDNYIPGDRTEENKTLLKQIVKSFNEKAYADVVNSLTRASKKLDDSLLKIYAYSLYKQRDFPRVIALVRAYPDLLFLKKLQTEIYIQRAFLDFRQKKYEGAYYALTRALSSSSKDPKLNFLAGVLCYHQGKYSEAKVFFEKASKDPQVMEGHLFLAALARLEGSPVDLKNLKKLESHPKYKGVVLRLMAK